MRTLSDLQIFSDGRPDRDIWGSDERDDFFAGSKRWEGVLVRYLSMFSGYARSHGGNVFGRMVLQCADAAFCV